MLMAVLFNTHSRQPITNYMCKMHACTEAKITNEIYHQAQLLQGLRII